MSATSFLFVLHQYHSPFPRYNSYSQKTKTSDVFREEIKFLKESKKASILR